MLSFEISGVGQAHLATESDSACIFFPLLILQWQELPGLAFKKNKNPVIFEFKMYHFDLDVFHITILQLLAYLFGSNSNNFN